MRHLSNIPLKFLKMAFYYKQNAIRSYSSNGFYNTNLSCNYMVIICATLQCVITLAFDVPENLFSGLYLSVL